MVKITNKTEDFNVVFMIFLMKIIEYNHKNSL
jgi:hypothetical protein